MLGKLNHFLNCLQFFKLLERLQTSFCHMLQWVLFLLFTLQVQFGITFFNLLSYLLKTDIDDCAGHPCKNNVTCIDRVNGFNVKCSFAPAFYGTQCETFNRKR